MERGVTRGGISRVNRLLIRCLCSVKAGSRHYPCKNPLVVAAGETSPAAFFYNPASRSNSPSSSQDAPDALARVVDFLIRHLDGVEMEVAFYRMVGACHHRRIPFGERGSQ